MGDEGLHSVGVTPPFPGTLAGYFLSGRSSYVLNSAAEVDNMEAVVD
jgi:hypothetical protein